MKVDITSIKRGDVVYIVLIYQNGHKQIVGQYLLPHDGQFRLDIAFNDEVLKAYRNRIRKMI